jgi:hypothetical protein
VSGMPSGSIRMKMPSATWPEFVGCFLSSGRSYRSTVANWRLLRRLHPSLHVPRSRNSARVYISRQIQAPPPPLLWNCTSYRLGWSPDVKSLHEITRSTFFFLKVIQIYYDDGRLKSEATGSRLCFRKRSSRRCSHQ